MLPDCWVSHFLKCLWTTAEHHVEHLPSPERVDNTIRNVRKRSNSRLCQRVEWQQRTWPGSSDTTPLLTSAEAQKQSWEKLLVPQWRDVLLRSSTHSSQFIFYPAAKWKSLSFKHFNTMFSAAGHRQACSPTQSFLFVLKMCYRHFWRFESWFAIEIIYSSMLLPGVVSGLAFDLT